MPKCVVYHNNIPGNGNSTTFEGENLKVSSTESGILSIKEWETTTQSGNAAFATDTWHYACFFSDKPEISNDKNTA